MIDPMIFRSRLAHFTGTETWYRNPIFPRWLYTDGVKYVADAAGAHWLVEAILSHQIDPTARAEEFQVWKLVRKGVGATLTMADGNTEDAIISQHIEYTDFPLDEIMLFFSNGVLYLPSEH